MGGRSSEREVSLKSGNAVLNALLKSGVNAYGFDTGMRDLSELSSEKFDRVFIALHGRYGEDGTIQGVLEQLRIPYTGSGVMASSISMDKVMTKRIWDAENLPIPGFMVLSDASQRQSCIDALGLPMVIKPAHEGSSIGVSKVFESDKWDSAYEEARKLDAYVLAEELIDGIELTCAVLEIDNVPTALPVVRINAPESNYDYQTKYFGSKTEYKCPSGFVGGIEMMIRDLTLESYKALGCRGWGRVDIMLRKSDAQPFLLEMNTSPGMTDHSLVPMAARAAGLSYEELCLKILESARLDK